MKIFFSHIKKNLTGVPGKMSGTVPIYFMVLGENQFFANSDLGCLVYTCFEKLKWVKYL